MKRCQSQTLETECAWFKSTERLRVTCCDWIDCQTKLQLRESTERFPVWFLSPSPHQWRIQGEGTLKNQQASVPTDANHVSNNGHKGQEGRTTWQVQHPEGQWPSLTSGDLRNTQHMSAWSASRIHPGSETNMPGDFTNYSCVEQHCCMIHVHQGAPDG